MKLDSVLPGDLVEVSIADRIFVARVEKKLPDADRFDIEILPIHPNISYRQAEAKQVKHHWKLMGRPRGRPKKDGTSGVAGKPRKARTRPRPGAEETVETVQREPQETAPGVQEELKFKPIPGRTRQRPGLKRTGEVAEAEQKAQERQDAVAEKRTSPSTPPRRPRPGTRAAVENGGEQKTAANPFLKK